MNMIPLRVALPAWRRNHKKPAIDWRVAHVDLKGPKIPPKVLCQLLRLYSRWGLNGVLVEYEHRLPIMPFDKQFPARDRYTKAELRTFLGVAAEYGIEWIPLVQMFGHQEYLFRLPGTARLMENPAIPNQLCPSRPAVKDYLRRLLDVICELHPGGRYLHAGMDETHWLGFCSVCRKRAKALGGALELYLDHAAWVCEEIRQRGRIPMIWGDMFLGKGRPDLIKRLSKDVIVAPWDYGSAGTRIDSFVYNGGHVCRNEFKMRYDAVDLRRISPGLPGKGGFVDDLSAADRREIGGLDDDACTAPAFPQLRALANHVNNAWCAGGAQMSADGQFHPNYMRGLLNGTQLAQSVLNVKGQGAIMTAWARGHSWAPINAPWPLIFYSMAQFAASAWSGRTRASDISDRQVAVAAELGLASRYGEWSLDDLFGILSRPTGGPLARAVSVRRVLELLKTKPRRTLFADSLVRTLELELIQLDLLFLIEEIRWWFPNARELPKEFAGEMRKRFKNIQVKLRSKRPQTRSWYIKWVGESGAFDIWWNGLFNALESLVAHGLKAL